MVKKSEEDRMDFIHSREDCNTGTPNYDPPLNALSRTDRLFIRNFHLSDIYAVHQYASDPPIVTEMTYVGSGVHITKVTPKASSKRQSNDRKKILEFFRFRDDIGRSGKFTLDWRFQASHHR